MHKAISLLVAPGLCAILLTGCSIGGSGSGSTPPVSQSINTTQNASGSGNTSSDPATSNTTINTTVSNGATVAPSSNTSNTTNTSSANTTTNTPPVALTANQQAAVKVVSAMYAAQAAKDATMKFAYNSTQTSGGHKVYVVQVYDEVNNNAATVAWVWVRDDGMVENGLLQSGWVTQAQYKAQLAG